MVAKILVAGTSSGVGKTTITMGLIAALARRGWQIQPFKAGPDYIDPTYHSLAAGRPCRNIDTWMVSPDRALALFHKATQNVDAAVIEGVMGLFDGFSYEDEQGSSAQIAKLLNSPVLLVLDVGKMARSAGAIAIGYTNFDPELPLAGFILNRCGSTTHYQGVKLAVENATGRPVLGWLPKDANLHIPERHLGLVPTDERGELREFIGHAAHLIEQYFDLDKILSLAASSSTQPELGHSKPCSQTEFGNKVELTHSQTPFGNEIAGETEFRLQQAPPSPAGTQIAVARDAAFSFYYEDNLDLLREAGAEILFFSPQADPDLPPDIDGLYIGGGFPEMHAAQLAANTSLKQAIRRAHAAGMPIYAECGGLMYLTEAIIDLEGRRHPMVGLVPGLAQMQPHLMSLGYRIVESPTGNFLLPQGLAARGHEFHWSSWQSPAASPAWLIRPRQGHEAVKADGYAAANLLASYVHLHFGYNPLLAQNFVDSCRRWKISVQFVKSVV
jgi:cobyrinic acid a,c-diamide synthase